MFSSDAAAHHSGLLQYEGLCASYGIAVWAITFTVFLIRHPKPLFSNQWTLGNDVTADPSQSSFRKAMGLANGTVSVMDKNAVCFTRVWCVFEIAESILRAAASSYSYGECAKSFHVLVSARTFSQ